MKSTLIIVSIIALAAVFGAIYVGGKSFDGVVTDKPYDKGLMWDHARHEHERLGWTIEIEKKDFTTGDNALSLMVFDKDRSPLKGARVGVTVSRPNTAAYDRSCQALEQKDGIYSCGLEFPLYGHWDVNVSITKDRNSVSFDDKIFVQKGA